MSRVFVLHNPAQGHEVISRVWAWAKGQVSEGRKVTLKVEEEKRTIPQNSHIHPVVTRIAKAAKRPTDKESLRRLRYMLLEQWRHETQRPPIFERSLDGMRWVCVDRGTSDLDKPDCSEFIDWMLAFEAMHT